MNNVHTAFCLALALCSAHTQQTQTMPGFSISPPHTFLHKSSFTISNFSLHPAQLRNKMTCCCWPKQHIYLQHWSNQHTPQPGRPTPVMIHAHDPKIQARFKNLVCRKKSLEFSHLCSTLLSWLRAYILQLGFRSRDACWLRPGCPCLWWDCITRPLAI